MDNFFSFLGDSRTIFRLDFDVMEVTPNALEAGATKAEALMVAHAMEIAANWYFIVEIWMDLSS